MGQIEILHDEFVLLFRNLAYFTFQHMHSDNTIYKESTYSLTPPHIKYVLEKQAGREADGTPRRARALTLNGPVLKHRPTTFYVTWGQSLSV